MVVVIEQGGEMADTPRGLGVLVNILVPFKHRTRRWERRTVVQVRFLPLLPISGEATGMLAVLGAKAVGDALGGWSGRDEMVEPLILQPSSNGLVTVWLLWVQYESGAIGLRGISTSNTQAVQWKKTLEHDTIEEVVRVWIDPTALDHLYAANLTVVLRRKKRV